VAGQCTGADQNRIITMEIFGIIVKFMLINWELLNYAYCLQMLLHYYIYQISSFKMLAMASTSDVKCLPDILQYLLDP
jgi:hypothetical protein